MVIKTESILAQLLIAFEESFLALAVTMASHIDCKEVITLICEVSCQL